MVKSAAALGLICLIALAATAWGAPTRLPVRAADRPKDQRAGASTVDSRRPTCVGAEVSLGPRVREIVYRVKCRRTRPGTVKRFMVGRYAIHGGPVRPGYMKIDRHPSVYVERRQVKSGTCMRKGSVIDCEARVDRRATIVGSFEVSSASRCHQGVSVRSVVSGQCHEQGCLAEAEPEVVLTDGLPKGCI
jgi:hypothetical protein